MQRNKNLVQFFPYVPLDLHDLQITATTPKIGFSDHVTICTSNNLKPSSRTEMYFWLKLGFLLQGTAPEAVCIPERLLFLYKFVQKQLQN